MQKVLEDVGIEMPAALLPHFHHCFIFGHGRLVDPLVQQRVVHIKDRHNAGRLGNIFTGQAARVTGTIPPLMVAQGYIPLLYKYPSTRDDE